MGKRIEIRVPNYPECWETCGNCANGEISIAEVLVAPGDQVRHDDVLIVLETGKITLSGSGKELLESDSIKKAYLGG